MAFDKAKFVEELKEMTVLELNDLVKAIEEEFGVTAAAPVAAAGGAEGGADAAPTEATVVLTAAGASKIPVVKAVQKITGLGLKDAKGLVDNAPGPIKENVPMEEAEAIKEELEGLGASVELQ